MYRKFRLALTITVVVSLLARTPWPGSGSTYDDITSTVFDISFLALVLVLSYDLVRWQRSRRLEARLSPRERARRRTGPASNNDH
jgi:hypothetical protein